jgi:hypothetical protein
LRLEVSRSTRSPQPPVKATDRYVVEWNEASITIKPRNLEKKRNYGSAPWW